MTQPHYQCQCGAPLDIDDGKLCRPCYNPAATPRPARCLLCDKPTVAPDHITRDVCLDERHFHRGCWLRWRNGERSER